MSRMQSTPSAAQASNNIFTVLTGTAFIVSLAALVITWLVRWPTISDQKLFFGIF